MAQLRDIKSRIESVQKTRKMTQAMKMVAASKFKRASEKVSQSTLYLGHIEDIISKLSSQSEGSIDNPLFQENSSEKTLYILLTGDRGLCGSFNTNIIKYADSFLSKDKHAELIIFGKKGYQHFRNKTVEINDYRERFFENLSVESVGSVISSITRSYEADKYGKVVLLYNKFISAVANEPVSKQLLPLSITSDEQSTSDDSILEPSIDDVLEGVSSQFLELTLYKACLESSAAEQGARMAAMDSATTNAGEMIQELTLLYNRQRQAQITTELSEIVAGAEALVS